MTAVDSDKRIVTVDAALIQAGLGHDLRLSRRCSYATQPDLPFAEFVTQTDANSPPTPTIPAGSYLAYLDVWQRAITAPEAPGFVGVALGGPDTTTRSRTVWQLRLLSDKAPNGLVRDDLSQVDDQLGRAHGHDGGAIGSTRRARSCAPRRRPAGSPGSRTSCTAYRSTT